jgi:outer membrane protein TolC
MSRWNVARRVVTGSVLAAAVGCASTPEPLSPSVATALPSGLPAPSTTKADAEKADPIRPVAHAESGTPGRSRPSYAQLETLPIDLPTVLRLVNENSPAVAAARASVREARARLDGADVLWLPNVSVGAAYNRFDGRTQNQAGNVFDVSRANLFGGGGPTLSLDVADAIYRPLIERRALAAESYRERAVGLGAELDAVAAYLDLVRVHAQIEITRDTIAKAEAMLLAATNARDAKLDRTAGDVQRSQTEVLFRKAERADLEGRAGAASARLGKLLLLPPTVKLLPADVAVRPLTLIDPSCSLDDLIALAVANRPDLAANRELIAAAWARVRRQERGPLFPKFSVADQVGSFGGGLNDDVQRFGARNVLSAQLYWELKNFGFGNQAETNERRATLDRAQYALVESQARVAAEIVEAAQLAAAKSESLELAEKAVAEVTELYRINKEGTFNVLDAKNLFDALRPLQAIQLLNQARSNYLAAVLDYTRAQYQLFALLGYPPRSATERP